MLMVAKTYNTGDVITFKLTIGEEIIARLSSDNTTEYILNKPMALLNTPQGGLGMMPVPISANVTDLIVLNKHAVAFHGKCQSDLATQYLEKTTGITMATGLI